MKEIKNLKKAAKRILKAIKNKEKIILYGDADLDGISSVIILEETIKNLGGEISAIYFPDREIEGYGLSETGLRHLKKNSPALLITLDCGIGNFKEIKSAKKIGFKVLVVDHHEMLDGLPEAEIIVDPKQKGDNYYFKGLAAAGIVFKLSKLILGDKMRNSLKNNFLELTALATIADMMPKEEENEIFIEEGLASLRNSWRPGIQAIFNAEPFRSFENINQKISKIISIMNIRDVRDGLPAPFRILTAVDSEQIKETIKELLTKNELRKKRIEETTACVEKRIKGLEEEPVIFEGSAGWDISLISLVASIMSQKYQKPAFLFKKLKEESQGTVRAPRGIDSVALMKKCKNLLLTYGGHAPASGFRIKNKNLEKFKKCLMKNCKTSINL